MPDSPCGRSASTDEQPPDPETVLDDLTGSLASLGVTLPSLRLETVPPWVECSVAPLVDLGRCTVETAHRLALALRARAASKACDDG